MIRKKKIAIVIPCWKRSFILGYVMKQFDVFYQAVKDKVDVVVVYVFSNNDPELKEMKLHYLKANHPRDYIYSSNDFLGQKLNDGIWHAMRFNFDWMMNCGSDDLIHPKLIDLYEKLMEQNQKLFGINRLYFYKDDEDPLFFSGYNKPYVVGAGRMIHKDIIQHIFQQYGGLYASEIRRGMDTMSSNLMHKAGYMEVTINPRRFPYVIDIKSDVNINSFTKINNTKHALKCIVTADRHFLNRHFKILQDYEQQSSHLSAQKIVG